MASSQSEENQHRLSLARRRAFETYLRYGRMPDQIVSAAANVAGLIRGFTGLARSGVNCGRFRVSLVQLPLAGGL